MCGLGKCIALNQPSRVLTLTKVLDCKQWSGSKEEKYCYSKRLPRLGKEKNNIYFRRAVIRYTL